MLFGNDRDALRRQYLNAFAKARNGETLEPLERLLADVIAMHPEYHALLESGDAVARDFTPDGGQTNPFLHMGLHVAIQEQLSTDRPAGFRDAYGALMRRLGDAHQVEHAVMECLAETLWEAQRAGRAPDEAAYLERVRKLERR